MLPNIGEIVWIDGKTAGLVVGHGVDSDNVSDGQVYVVELGAVTAIGPGDDGAYNFGSSPYDANAKPGTNDQGGVAAHPGGFREGSPVVESSSNAATSSSDGAPLTPGAPGSFVGDAEPGTGTGPENPSVPAGTFGDAPSGS